MPGNLIDNFDVFYGELTPARATVYARLEGLENSEGLTLSGFVRGPRCLYSTTLLSTYPLADAGLGPSLLAKSLVTDPCYWSPEAPNIYDVTIELRRGQDIIASDVRQIGFKPLGISGRFFTWEGKPWIMRGVRMMKPPALPITAWRVHSSVAVFPNDDHLTEASEKGIICFCGVPEEDALKEARRLARFPAVCFANLYGGVEKAAQLMPNIICCWPYPLGNFLPPAHKCILMRSVDVPPKCDDPASSNVPIIVYRLAEPTLSLPEARAACDKLQADLAPVGQFAGYQVCPFYD